MALLYNFSSSKLRYASVEDRKRISTHARLNRSIKFRAFRCRNFRQDSCTLTLMSHTTFIHDASPLHYRGTSSQTCTCTFLYIYMYADTYRVHNIHASRYTEIHNTPGRIRGGLLRDPESEATDYFP